MNRKECLSKNFSKAAKTYEKYSFIQEKAAEYLLDFIPRELNPKNILEIGCGPANFTRKLVQKFPDAEITAIDISNSMLEMAKQANLSVKFVEADAEDFVSTENFDLIISNATFQWLTDFKQKGFFVVSMFGPQTFKELAEIVDEDLPAESFKSVSEIKKQFSEVFEIFIEKEYESLFELLKYIKNTGTKIQQNKIWTKSKIDKIQQKYLEKFGKIKVTYHLIFARGLIQ